MKINTKVFYLQYYNICVKLGLFCVMVDCVDVHNQLDFGLEYRYAYLTDISYLVFAYLIHKISSESILYIRWRRLAAKQRNDFDAGEIYTFIASALIPKFKLNTAYRHTNIHHHIACDVYFTIGFQQKQQNNFQCECASFAQKLTAY